MILTIVKAVILILYAMSKLQNLGHILHTIIIR